MEAAAARKLAAAVSSERKNFEAYIKALTRIDVAAERARLAAELKLVRPLIRKYPAAIKMVKARFLPLEAKLAEAGLRYTPLTASFSRRVNVIYGSNMGGKTVALKTLAFAQLLTQSGFFIPAASFETCLFDGAAFIGGADMETAGGLSSFGLEMNDFASAHAISILGSHAVHSDAPGAIQPLELGTGPVRQAPGQIVIEAQPATFRIGLEFHPE